ncbi:MULTISPECIES: MFS transporter [unclassified Rathayibacter]|uniref:MFS transporter n=1 Tax=unclassified Rathayibacter TaxID=2609250 RepID=UPI000FAAEBBC|nr:MULTISPECIES: MFS transporter [unclassified Rathayibacter]ROP45234.1 EmrB/QacA subfamily drug resistance transporter [Rathayibacter sp. PhB186]ROS48278.1 EmrB/QacA subfamily drug resistance transporter [Rathayibacter sp. PhB185]
MTSPDNAPDAPPTAAEEGTRWRAFAVAVSVAAFTILDLSKVNVGLPSIEKSLSADPSQLQLIVAGYALAFGLSLVPSGRLGDIKSRRLLFLVGLTAFTLASLLCAVAPTIELLVIARFIQGIAAGIQMPQVLGLVQQLFTGAARARAFGVFGAVIGLSTAFGPTLGGLLIAIGGEQDGWRLLFWMNIPLGIAALVFAWKLLPKVQRTPQGDTSLDPVGLLLLGVTIFAFMLPFLLTTGASTDSPFRWLWLLLAAVAAYAFVKWEAHYAAKDRTPVIDFRIFRTSSYRNGILVATSYFAAIPATFLLTTLFLQQGLGLAPVFAGMVSIPFALTSAVTAWYGGKLVQRYGRALVVLGIVLVVIGFTLVLLAAELLPAETAAYGMGAAMLVAGAGGGFVVSPNQTLTLAEISPEQGGVAGSVGQLGQRVGTAVGTACASAIFFATLASEAGMAEGLDRYHDAFRNGYFVTLGLIALALVLGLLDLRRRRVTARATR